jgi:hypothetical protein
MSASFRTLLNRIIDYAGLFPPARLPLDQALRHYLRYRQEPESWMLGRIVIPAERLAELASLHELFDQEAPLSLAALGRGGRTLPDFMAGLYADLADIATFRQRHGDRAEVDVFEVRLPARVVGPYQGEALDEEAFFRAVSAAIERDGPPSLTPFYEMPREPQGPLLNLVLLAALARHNADVRQPRLRVRKGGVKLRMGGLEAAAFPSTEGVAFVLQACREAGVPLKCTAGLHHPLRRYDPALEVTMHGFVNVFVAGVLGKVHHLGADVLQAILEDGDAGHFACDENGLNWQEYRATTEQVRVARQDAVLTFGSCSFDEPRDDLRALKWL